MTDENDPLDRELPPEILDAMRRPPMARRVRLASGLSRVAFARTYGIPEDLLRRWEQGDADPDPTAAAYLRAILNDPEAVAAAYNKPGADKTAAE